MPATKRKRSSGRRSYKRGYKRRSGVSVSGVVRALAKANASMGPFGPGTANYERYGPSKRQMLEIKGAMLTPTQKQNRILDNYHGDGDYLSSVGTGVGVGGAIGGLAGGPIGAGVGALIGGGLGAYDEYLHGTKRTENLLDRFMGKGDYSNVNQIAGGGDVISVNRSSRSGDIFIEQTEFIGNLTASVTNSVEGAVAQSKFDLESYEINPGMSKLFPFLSQLASNYELYEWDGLMVKYTPNSGETSVSSNQLGKIIVATNYDPDCADFRNSIEMQNYDYANSCKPSHMLVHGVETARSSGVTNMLYVRDAQNKKDRVLTDIGKLFIATEGVPITQSASSGVTNVILGELHITYRIRLSRAKLYQSFLGYNIKSDKFYREASGSGYWMDSAASKWDDNAGDWALEAGTGASINIKGSKQLVAGCYKWTLLCNTSVGGSSEALSLSTVTAVQNTAVIQTSTTSNSTLGDFNTAAKPVGVGTMVAYGYFEVDNTDDKDPKFRITLSRNRTTNDTTCYCKFSITQVSCRIKDDVW